MDDIIIELPKGYEIKRESKTTRTSLVMRPTYFALLEDVAARKGISRNELLNNIIEDYLDAVMSERVSRDEK